MTIAKVYGPALQSLMAGEINFTGSTIKCALTSASYVPDQDTHRYFSSITNEVSGAGYTLGGATLASKTSTYSTTTNTLTIDSADPNWATLSIAQIRFAIFYVSTGVASTSALISYMDFETNYAPSAQAFTVVLPSTGIATFTVA